MAQQMELRWWKHYLKQKPPSDYLVWKQKYWLDFLDRIHFPKPKGKKILDAGCGPAGIFTVLSDNEVRAIDPLLNSYESDLDHFNPKDWPWVRFEQGMLENGRGAGSFDVVFCLNAINHVARLDLAIDQLMNHVKPGGKLILSSDLHNFSWLKKLFRLIPGDILHPQQDGLSDYLKLLDKPGWKWEKPILFKREMIFSYYVFVGTKEPSIQP